MSSKSYAPWTPEEVANLNAWQTAGFVHPFTWGDAEKQVDLIATPDGWVAEEGGPVVQNWAHLFMVDGSAFKCARCGQPAAYFGARFCGAACLQAWEAHE